MVMRKLMIMGAAAAAIAITGCYYPGPCIEGYGPVVTESRYLEDFTAVSNSGSFEVRVTLADSFSVKVEAQENLHSVIETYVSGSTLVVKTSNGNCIQSIAPVLVYVTLPEVEEIRNTDSGRLSADRSNSVEFEIVNSGSGDISIDSLFSFHVSARNSGSGRIYLTGTYAEEVELVQTGSGLVESGAIYGTDVTSIDHSSSGRISGTLVGGNHLDAKLSGSGRIELWGDAVTADYFLSASGKIEALDLVASDVYASISGSGKIYLHAIDYLEAVISGSGDVIYRGNPLLSTRITGSGSVRPY